MKHDNGTIDAVFSASGSRRDFLRVCGRTLILTAGALAAGHLVRRGQVATETGESCLNNGVCSGCSANETCELPAAKSRRRALQQRKPEGSA